MLLPQRLAELVWSFQEHEEHTAVARNTVTAAVHTIGIDTGKNTLHMIALDVRGAIVLREKVSRSRITARLVNVPPCLIGIGGLPRDRCTSAGSGTAERVQRHLSGPVIASDHQQLLARRGVPPGRISVHAIVATFMLSTMAYRSGPLLWMTLPHMAGI